MGNGVNTEKKDPWWHKLVISVVEIAVVIIASAGVVFIAKRASLINADISDFNVSLIIAFIGVLATFIVVSNYSQVSDIRNRVDNEIEKFKQQYDAFVNDKSEKSVFKRLNKLESDKDTINSDILELKGKTKKIDDMNPGIQKDTVNKMLIDRTNLLIKCFQSEYSEILFEYMLDRDAIYRIKYCPNNKDDKTSTGHKVKFTKENGDYILKSITGNTKYDIREAVKEIWVDGRNNKLDFDFSKIKPLLIAIDESKENNNTPTNIG